MTHVFVAPHPDDVALSCGGLILGLRELGQDVAILTVFSGVGSLGVLTRYQREALGFGSKAVSPNTEAFDGADIHDRARTGQPLMDDVSRQGVVLTDDLVDARAAGDVMAERRLEDERYAAFAEASIDFLDLADAVFRGYEGDEALLGRPRDDDPPPVDLLRREIARLEPQKVYLPLGIGDHVDHQLVREVGIALLGETRRRVMPGPQYTGRVTFYEDFPYACWNEFARLQELPADALAGLPTDVALTPEYTDIADQVERKIRGIALYESQIERLFGSIDEMADAVRIQGTRIGRLGGTAGMAERYWATSLRS